MNNKCPLSESASWVHEHRRRLAAIKREILHTFGFLLSGQMMAQRMESCFLK